MPLMKFVSSKHRPIVIKQAFLSLICLQIYSPYICQDICQAQDNLAAEKKANHAIIRSIDGVVSVGSISEIDARASLNIDMFSEGSKGEYSKDRNNAIIKYISNERVFVDPSLSGNLPNDLIKFGSPDVDYLDNDTVRAEIFEQLIRD